MNGFHSESLSIGGSANRNGGLGRCDDDDVVEPEVDGHRRVAFGELGQDGQAVDLEFPAAEGGILSLEVLEGRGDGKPAVRPRRR